MSNESVVKYPDTKQTILFITGLVIGVATPSLFVSVIEGIASSNMVKDLFSSRIDTITQGKGLEKGDAVGITTFALLLIILSYALAKAGSLIKVLGTGVGIGIILRIVLIAGLGIDIPMAAEGNYTVPQ